MNMNRNEDFFSKNCGKLVHVDFIDSRDMLMSAVGNLSCEERENDDGDLETFVIIESDTDLDVIPIINIKKIFTKEE